MASEKRLIDANALYENICVMVSEICMSAVPDTERFCFLADGIYTAIQTAPTVDAVILPCKLGTPVFIAGKKYRAGRTELFVNTGKFRLSDIEKVGVTVFLTREEAEAALMGKW